MEPSIPQDQTPPINPEPTTNPEPPVAPATGQPISAQEATPQTEQPAASYTGKLPSAFSLFKPSWESVKLNLNTFVVLGVVPYIIFVLAFVLLGLGGTMLGQHNSAEVAIIPATLFGLLFVAATLVLAPALIYTQIQSVQGNKIEPGRAFSAGKRLWLRFLGLSIVIGIIILVGFVLLIVPGFFMLRRYILAPYFMVDKDLSINEAMEQSVAASNKYSGAIWGLIGVTILLSLPGIVPVIGGIVSAVLGIAYYCAPAVRYREVTTGVPSIATK